MKILFVGKRFYTNRDALSERYGRIYQLPYHWQKKGVDAHLWLIDYHEKKTISQTADHELPIISTPVLSLGMTWKLIKTLFDRQDRPDVIVASGDCYIGLMTWAVSKWLKVKFVFDIYDRYDQFPGYWRLLWLDPLTFLRNKADICLFASRVVPDALGGKRESDIITPNGIDTLHFRSLEKRVCRERMGLSEKGVLVGYFGSMEPDRGVSDLLDAIGSINAKETRVRLLISGKRDASIDLERPNIIYLGNAPYEKMPTVMGCCDVLVLPYRRSTLLDASASVKIAEYIASGRPIAATRTPNLLANFPHDAEFVELLAEPESPHSLASAIVRVLDAPPKMALPKGIEWSSIAHSTLKDIRITLKE